MHMLFADKSTQDLNLKTCASLPYQLPHPMNKVALLQVITKFRDPNKMVLNLIFSVTPLAIFYDYKPQLLASCYPSEKRGL